MILEAGLRERFAEPAVVASGQAQAPNPRVGVWLCVHPAGARDSTRDQCGTEIARRAAPGRAPTRSAVSSTIWSTNGCEVGSRAVKGNRRRTRSQVSYGLANLCLVRPTLKGHGPAEIDLAGHADPRGHACDERANGGPPLRSDRARLLHHPKVVPDRPVLGNLAVTKAEHVGKRNGDRPVHRRVDAAK